MRFIAASFFIFIIFAGTAFANGLPDMDQDGVPDEDEFNIYFTNPFVADTDNDGYSDWLELNKGMSPHNPLPVKLADNDVDNDGLSDYLELYFKTNLVNPDTDGDGILDGEEIQLGLNPKNPSVGAKLDKRIEINTDSQELSYFLGDVRLAKFKASTGKPSMPTPKGTFKVENKIDKAWSRTYGLWMPFWMGIGRGYGIHELPVWPGGYREGENHLGVAVSHGCVRLGIGAAEQVYAWAEIGTPVYVK